MNAEDEVLLGLLREFRREHPDWRFGQMICMLTILARDDEPGSIWEMEDGELLEAARRMLAERRSEAATHQVR